MSYRFRHGDTVIRVFTHLLSDSSSGARKSTVNLVMLACVEEGSADVADKMVRALNERYVGKPLHEFEALFLPPPVTLFISPEGELVAP